MKNKIEIEVVEVISQLLSGGAERFVVDLSNELSKSTNVTLVVLQKIEENWFLINELLPSVKVISLNKGVGLSLKTMFSLYNIFRKKKNIIIHTHLTAIYYIILFIFLKPSFRLFHTLHNDAKVEAYSKVGLIFRKICFNLNFISPITISDASRDSFEDLYHFKPKMIYNGRSICKQLVSKELESEFLKYRRTDKTKILINIANIQKSKNQLMLAKCVDKLVKEGYDITLLIIGRWAYQDIVDKIYGINNSHIFLLGEKSNAIDYLSECDAFCLSSIYEGMPITLIESLALGVIPICTPAGGISNVIRDGVNGYLSKSLSEEDYIFSLKSFLEAEDDQLQKIRMSLCKTYEQFTMEKCSRDYLDYFVNKH